jgi:hypothetical protein
MKTELGRSIPVIAWILVACATLPFGSASAVAQTPPVQPAISPALPAEGDLIFAGLDVTGPPAYPSGPLVEGANIFLGFSQPPVSPQPPSTTTHLAWALGALPAGNYMIMLNSGTVPSLGFVVRPRVALLGLIDGRFRMSVADQQAGASPAAVQMSDAGGYFTFFDPTNVELTAKIVDGRAVNGHFWVFVASMTNTPLTVTVIDTQAGNCGGSSSCPTRTYKNPPNTNQNFIDVEAF